VPDYTPPTDYQGTPLRFVLPAESRLWLVHAQKRDATEFLVPSTDARAPGGRFDGTYADPYPVCYAALDPAAALADVVLRSTGATGARVVRRTSVARMRASVVATVEDLPLVDLRTGPALAAVAQDGWLVTADCGDYPLTRRWGSWIRSKAPWALGFVWATGGSAAHCSVVLFGDRCEARVFARDPYFTIDLDDEVGAVWLNSQLVSFGAQLEAPRKR
jgi:hypothetical protein